MQDTVNCTHETTFSKRNVRSHNRILSNQFFLFIEEQVTIKNKFLDIERRLEVLLLEQQRDDNELPAATSTAAATKNRRFMIFYEFYRCH